MRNEESEPCICRPCKGGGKAQYSKDDIVWYLPPLQGRGRGCLRMRNLQGRTNKIYPSRQTVSEKPNNHEKIYIFGKKCIISAFFLQLSAKKNNKDYIKTLDTEQNADYTIMDWVYWLFNASLSKYHQEEKT